MSDIEKIKKRLAIAIEKIEKTLKHNLQCYKTLKQSKAEECIEKPSTENLKDNEGLVLEQQKNEIEASIQDFKNIFKKS